MSWIAGIDYSTHAIDVVLIDENDVKAPVWRRYPLNGADAFDRTRNVGNRESDWGTWREWTWDDVLAIGIEDPAGNHGTNYLYRVQGAILANIPTGLLVQPWRPSAWRKAVGLKGNCSKEDVFTFAIRQINRWHGTPGAWPIAVPTDATDAYCIALATRQAITREQAA